VALEPHHTALPAVRGRDADEPIPWQQFTTLVGRRHGVTAAALVLIAAQIVWKALVLRHFYFWQDDFTYFDRAIHSGLTWSYLAKVQSGHLDIGPFALSWVIARLSLYNWTLVSFVLLAILLAGCLALLRLLRTLFGNRPAILIPLIIFLLCPLTVPDLVWWSNGIEGVGLQLAIFMSLDAHVRYLRTGARRQLAFAACWVVVGMLFSDKGIVVPFLILGVTAWFLVEGSATAALFRSVVRFWRAWVAYGVLVAGYAGLLAYELTTQPGAVPTKVTAPHGVGTFMADIMKDSFIPGALGGPWQWFGNGIDAFANPPAVLWRLALLVAAAIVGATIWYRRRAWRAWAILALWILFADMAPIIIGRTSLTNPAFTVFLGMDTHYVADAVGVLVICLSLALWPVADLDAGVSRPNVSPHAAAAKRVLPAQVVPTMTGFALAAFVVGSIYSVQTYVGATTTAPGRSFIATAREAVAATPPGTVIVDELAPPSIMLALLLGPVGYEDQVIGNIAPGKFSWVKHPYGTINDLRVFTPDGRLWPAGVIGVYSRLLPAGTSCWPAVGDTIDVRLNGTATVTNGPWTVRLAYVSKISQQVSVSFGQRSSVLQLRPGLNTAYVPVLGSGSSVSVVTADPAATCIGNIAVGGLFANKSDTPVPAHPAAG
jgi:hypothetical protein